MGTYISNTTVSNSEYKLFVEKHDYEAPLYWNNAFLASYLKYIAALSLAKS